MQTELKKDIALYEPILPVKASWSLEYPEETAAIFFQEVGNQVRIVGSRSWQFAALNKCFEDVRDTMPWMKASLNIIPPAGDNVWSDLFDKAGLKNEQAPKLMEVEIVALTRELISMLVIDTASRPWETAEENNTRLIDSVNGYGSDPMKSRPGTFASGAAHSWEVYMSRALELLACWRHFQLPGGWGPNPNKTSRMDWDKEHRRLRYG